MCISRWRLCIRGVVMTVAVGSTAWGYSSGPPNGVTGAPGEGTCGQIGCHSTFPLNSGGGTLSITAPVQYTLNDTLEILVGLNQDAQKRWGFEITALNSAGQPVGQLLVADPVRTQLSTAPSGRQYVKHTSVGTDRGTGNVAPGWTLKWIAPSSDAGDVTFYAAGNAANDNGLSTGDYIYTATGSVAPPPSSCAILTTGDVNLSGTITSADIIYLVNFVFKGGDAPGPCAAAGDVNCTATITSADIIYLVNHVFKGGDPPCDVCALIPASWTCP